MKIAKSINNYFLQIIRKIILSSKGYTTVLDQATMDNMNRIFNLSLIIIPLRLINILLFASNTDPLSETWRKGIIISHLTILIIWVGICIIVRRLKRKSEANAAMKFIQYFAVIVIMISGIIIVAIDQLITSNITPFMLVSIVVGSIFLLRPIMSAIIFLTSYIAFYYALGLTITNEQLLLSNRANGITIVAIGFIISALIWHYYYINFTQKQRIEEQQKQLEQLAYFDQLTKLHNRHAFHSIVEKEIALMKRYGHESTLILLDTDGFKLVNDTYGHLVGDELLKQLGQLLLDHTRESDTVARFGGEEFIILAPRTSLKDGAILANKLRDKILDSKFYIDQHTISITASFGVAPLEPSMIQGFKNSYSKVDQALYFAKTNGKNRVEIYSQLMSPNSSP